MTFGLRLQPSPRRPGRDSQAKGAARAGGPGGSVLRSRPLKCSPWLRFSPPPRLRSPPLSPPPPARAGRGSVRAGVLPMASRRGTARWSPLLPSLQSRLSLFVCVCVSAAVSACVSLGASAFVPDCRFVSFRPPSVRRFPTLRRLRIPDASRRSSPISRRLLPARGGLCCHAERRAASGGRNIAALTGANVLFEDCVLFDVAVLFGLCSVFWHDWSSFVHPKTEMI